mgnify:CR=1 FL=1
MNEFAACGGWFPFLLIFVVTLSTLSPEAWAAALPVSRPCPAGPSRGGTATSSGGPSSSRRGHHSSAVIVAVIENKAKEVCEYFLCVSRDHDPSTCRSVIVSETILFLPCDPCFHLSFVPLSLSLLPSLFLLPPLSVSLLLSLSLSLSLLVYLSPSLFFSLSLSLSRLWSSLSVYLYMYVCVCVCKWALICAILWGRSGLPLWIFGLRR